MISSFFITRPKFAFVISIVISIAGVLALVSLPIDRYPELTPPSVKVSAVFPGADATTIADTVAGPLESAINGVDDMLYMSSNSANDGSYVLTVSFAVGTDPDTATVNVQNRVSQATPKLPEEVKRQGVTVRKQSSSMLLIVNIISPEDTFDSLFLSNYTDINIRDALARIPGVGDASIIGARDYSMRLWLEPNKLAGLGMQADDVINAVREQNVQVAAGKLGAEPTTGNTQFEYTLRTKGRLTTAAEFANIIIRVNSDGGIVRVKDVARVELGAKSYASYGLLDGKDSALLAIYQAPGANALEMSAAIRAEMDALASRFPDDVEYRILYDSTDLIGASISELVVTLMVAILLVVLVVFIFIQDWRSTLIPIIAIPVSLIGTFAGLMALGYSINLITLFGLILAIGIVVDDAIIVVENVQRHMAAGLKPSDATYKAMSEISGAIIATTLVLLAVFVPVGFIPGMTGLLFKQFSVTISIAVLISSINALTLSPALCAIFLKPIDTLPETGFFGWFNHQFEKLRHLYAKLVARLLKTSSLALILFAGIVVLASVLMKTIPSGFVPLEDNGAFVIDIQLPDGASLSRTEAIMEQASLIVKNQPGVTNIISAPGFSMLKGAVSANAGMLIVILESWDERTDSSEHEEQIVASLRAKLGNIAGANLFPFQFPPIPGLGATGGFEYQLQSTASASPQEMAAVMRGFVVSANQHPKLSAVFSTFKAGVPQIFLNIDREKAKLLGVPLQNIFSTLSTSMGGGYINDFNKFGKSYQVTAQASSEFRSDIQDILNLYVRNQANEMVPLRTLVTTESLLGPDVINRFNIYRSIKINGSAAPGASSGDAITAMEELSATALPDGYTFSWTGQAYQEILAGDQTSIIFILAIIFVYLFLVAQYESWMIPFSVLMAVPIALAGAVLMQMIAGQINDIYMQIGMVLLIGMSAKNAILIVEFAMELRRDGKSIVDAALTAASLRFRAVLMTAFSFILGVLPLVIASGAGSASRRSLGTAVFGGMLASIVIATVLVPVFYMLIQRLRERVSSTK
ncbi:MAG: multidrug efflux RND transporter permease subunit [Xanthomonadales bacterium]|nr:multidrug efflux RND transporter permease subunit [Xanthomonadales bacterium]